MPISINGSGTVRASVIQHDVAGAPPLFNDGAGVEIGELVRSWANFNGTGTIATRGSFNVSSIVDNSVGYYGANFATTLVDSSFAHSHTYTSEVSVYHTVGFFQSSTSSSINIMHFNVTNSANVVDKALVTIAVFR